MRGRGAEYGGPEKQHRRAVQGEVRQGVNQQDNGSCAAPAQEGAFSSATAYDEHEDGYAKNQQAAGAGLGRHLRPVVVGVHDHGGGLAFRVSQVIAFVASEDDDVAAKAPAPGGTIRRHAQGVTGEVHAQFLAAVGHHAGLHAGAVPVFLDIRPVEGRAGAEHEQGKRDDAQRAPATGSRGRGPSRAFPDRFDQPPEGEEQHAAADYHARARARHGQGEREEQGDAQAAEDGVEFAAFVFPAVERGKGEA